MPNRAIKKISNLRIFLKWQSQLMKVACSCSLALLIISCDSNTSQTQTSQTSSEATADNLELAVVNDFATQVIIPTYQQLATEADTLLTRVNTFVETPTAETLQAAQEAWIAARFPWEQGEAFAFGPADSFGYDADLDDWPVNETDVNAILNSNDELTPEYVV